MVEKKLSPNNRKANGQSASAKSDKKAVEKGKKFEDMVAALYRLLGADVTQNIMLCGKKVDILATFRLPGSPTGHRVIVECKDEKKAAAQNQRVMQFKGLLDTLRKSGEAESADIITRVPWSEPAKGFARDSGITLLTYRGKIAQLIDFGSYLKDTVDRFEKRDPRRPSEPPLGAYYVDLSAEYVTDKGTETFPIIDDYVKEWMSRDGTQRHLAILGEYGSGKTSLCQKLAHDLAISYLQAPGYYRIPILINLREFTKTLKIESLITSFLDEECGATNPRYRLFQAMNEAGVFLLIFDGLDEMAVRVDADTLEINLQEIEKLAASLNSRVIITCRLEYFVSSEEEKRCLYPKGTLLATRQIEYEPLKVIAWDDKQVELFLEKRVPLVEGASKSWTYYRDRIRTISGLSDLSRRPVLLEMIVKTLPQLISNDKPINRPNLYETYLLGEIKRQKILKTRTLLLSEAVRFSLLQHLATDFYLGEISAIMFADALKHVEEIVKPPRNELEAYTREFLTCSFLVRRGDQYLFSHRSISEYLTARVLGEEVKNGIPVVFGRKRLDRVVASFVAEMRPSQEVLWSWLKLTKSGVKPNLKYLGGNAATVLCMLDKNALAGKDMSGIDLTGADLTGANLINTNFKGTMMQNVNLVNAQFIKEDLALGMVDDVTICIWCLAKTEEIRKINEKAIDDIRVSYFIN